MKVKILAVLSLAMFVGFAGCRGTTNTNTTTTNTNMMTATPMAATPMATPIAVADPAAKTAVEAALKKAGLNDVMVDATTTEVTLRGTVAKGKMADAVRIANEAGKRKVNNQVSEK